MKPPAHAVVSLSIGGVLWATTNSPHSFVAAALTGVLIDLDHLVDYYRWFVKGAHSRAYFFLHSYELLVPAYLAGYLSGWDPVVMGVSFAFLGHLLCDQLANPVGPLTYFFTYRAMKGFRRSAVVDVAWEDVQRGFLHLPGARSILRVFNHRLKVAK